MKIIINLIGFLLFFVFFNSYAYWILTQDDDKISEIKNKRDLLLIFSMKKSYWDDGHPIILIVLPSNNKVHQDFIRNNLGISSNILDNIWDINVHSGNKSPPIVVNSKDEMINLIRNTEGSIGYVYTNHIPGLSSVDITDLVDDK